MSFTNPEMVAAFDSVDSLRYEFPVNNPSASIADMKRHLRGQQETFPCYGGFKSFYMDWNYDMWRCDSGARRFPRFGIFADAPPVRDGCTACGRRLLSRFQRDCCISPFRWATHSIICGAAVCALPPKL